MDQPLSPPKTLAARPERRRTRRLLALTPLAGACALLWPALAMAQQQTWTTPGTHNYTVPVNVTSVQVDLAGGGGGGGGFDNIQAGAGGQGGSISGTVRVQPGDVLAVTVGAGGGGATSNYGPLSGTPRRRVPVISPPWGGTGGAGASDGGAGGEPGNDGQGFSGGGGGGGGGSMVSMSGSFALRAGGGGGGSGDSVTGTPHAGGVGGIGDPATLTSNPLCLSSTAAGGNGLTIQGKLHGTHTSATGVQTLIEKEDGGGGGGGGGGYPAGLGGDYGYDGIGTGYTNAFAAYGGTGGGSCFYSAAQGQVTVIPAALAGGAGGPPEPRGNPFPWPTSPNYVRTNGGKDGQVQITPLTGMVRVELAAITNWPAAQSATVQVQVECGGQTYSRTVTYTGALDTAVIDDIPLGSSCTVSQQLPAAPTGFLWGTPVIPTTSATVDPTAPVPVLQIVNSLRAAGTGQVAAVPTLGEWALMGLGLGLVGLAAPALRRRRKG